MGIEKGIEQLYEAEKAQLKKKVTKHQGRLKRLWEEKKVLFVTGMIVLSFCIGLLF
jgi:protein associated with RNAse G/E